MSLHDYRFRSVWVIGATDGSVVDAVTDPRTYPLWWPDIRAVSRVDEDTAEVTCRSLLPYRLVFRLRRAEHDERTGRFRVDMTGDLEGFCGCRVERIPYGTRLTIMQQVVVRKPLLRTLAPAARPLFTANHAAMMWRGQRGLRAFLAPAPTRPRG